nr:MAG TPA: hypothetical protein [Caudoviricetes sp.]DAY81311.1 MAG TPA: hypothetical protein [Caudoviricetes sp.]
MLELLILLGTLYAAYRVFRKGSEHFFYND